jgi:hypothetical protein
MADVWRDLGARGLAARILEHRFQLDQERHPHETLARL